MPESDSPSPSAGAIPAAVLRAWDANLEVDLAFAAHLTDAMMRAETSEGGMRIDRHLGHVLGATAGWGTTLEADQDGPCHRAVAMLLDETEESARPLEREEVADAMRRVAAAARAAAVAAPSGSDRMPHADASAYLLHMLVHHAHHRAQMLLALKAAGHPLPDEDALWAPWRRSDDDGADGAS